MKSQNKFLLLVVFIIQMLQINAQTINQPIYSTDWLVRDLESKGDTLFAGGWFSHIGKYSQGMALFTTSSDQPNQNLAKMDEGLVSATGDGNGGYYILTANQIKHVLSNLSIDPTFSIPCTVNYYRERMIVYHNGIIYISGDVNSGSPAFIAYNVTNQQPVTTLPSVNGSVRNIRIIGNNMYIIGDFDTVNNLYRDQVAQISLPNHNVTSWYPIDRPCYNGSWFTCSDVAEYGNDVVLGGSFVATCEGGGLGGGGVVWHCLFIDATTGATSKRLFPDTGLFNGGLNQLYWAAGVSRIAIIGNKLYTYSSGTFDTRLTMVDLSNGSDTVIWARFFNIGASANEVAVTATDVYIAGANFEEIYLRDSTNDNPQNIEARVRNVLKLDASTGAIANWYPDPVGLIDNEVGSMILTNNNILIAGKFSHVNGIDRKGLYAVNNSTNQALPYLLNYNQIHEVNSMKRIGDTLFLAGNFDDDNFDTIPNKTVIAINISNGQEIPLSLPFVGVANKMEINNHFIILSGGVSDTTGGIAKTELLAINRTTQNVDSWNPSPDWDVTALHIAGDTLYVGGNFTNISGQTRNGIAAYNLNNLVLLNWHSSASGEIRTIKSDDSLVYLGGYIASVNSINVENFTAVRKTDGSAVKYANLLPNPIDIYDIVFKNKTLIASGFSHDSCTNPAIFKGNTVLNKTNDICINVSEGNQKIYVMKLIGNDLIYAGSFLKTNDSLMGTNIGRITFPAGYFNDSLSSFITATTQPNSTIYPNPTYGKLYIQNDEVLTNEILCIDGRIVLPKNNRKAIDISFLPSGIYIVHCYNKEGLKIQSEKIVKQ